MNKNTKIGIFAIAICLVAITAYCGYALYENSQNETSEPISIAGTQYGGELIGTIEVNASDSFSEDMTVSVPVSIYTGEPTSGTLSWVDVDASSTTQLSISGTAPETSGTYICTVFYVTEIGDCYDYVIIQVI